MSKETAPIVEEKHESPKECIKEKLSGCKCPFAPLRDNRVVEKLGEIFHWKNLLLSGLSLVIFNIILYVIVKLGYSFLTLFCYFVLIGTILCFAVGYGPVAYGEYVAKKKVENPIAPYAEKIKIPRDWIKDTAKLAGDFVNSLLETVFNVIFVKDVCETIKAFFFFCVLAILSNCYSFCGLAWVVVDFFFIWTPLYDLKKDLIDDLYERFSKLAKENYEKVVKIIKDAMNKQKAQ